MEAPYVKITLQEPPRPLPHAPVRRPHGLKHAHRAGRRRVRGHSLARHPCGPGQGNHAPATPYTATHRGPPPPGGTTEGIKHLPQNALTQPGRRPLNAFPGRQQRPALRGGPPSKSAYQHLCAATPGALHCGETYPGRPHRRVDLVVQLPRAGPVADMGPTPGLRTHACRPADGTPTCT